MEADIQTREAAQVRAAQMLTCTWNAVDDAFTNFEFEPFNVCVPRPQPLPFHCRRPTDRHFSLLKSALTLAAPGRVDSTAAV